MAQRNLPALGAAVLERRGDGALLVACGIDASGWQTPAPLDAVVVPRPAAGAAAVALRLRFADGAVAELPPLPAHWAAHLLEAGRCAVVVRAGEREGLWESARVEEAGDGGRG